MTVPEALREHFYGRAYVFINVMPTGHSVFMNAGSTGYPVSNFLEIGFRRGVFQPSIQQNGPNVPRLETTPLVGGPPPIGRWFCLEWEFIDKPDRIVMWVDGKLVANQPQALQGKDADLTGGFFEYALGFRSWGNNPTDEDIYYDDIAIGDKPIGPLPPVAAPAAPAGSSTAK